MGVQVGGTLHLQAAGHRLWVEVVIFVLDINEDHIFEMFMLMIVIKNSFS